MSNKQWRNGDHLVICDSCGAQRYRSECSFTWDGLLCCHIRNCWYPKHNLFNPLPVINDPQTIQDVRPEQPDSFVSDANITGLTSTWNHLTNPIAATENGRLKWNNAHIKWGHIDDTPNYAGL